jgi:hypothetical protein
MPNFNENNIGFTKFCQKNVTEVPGEVIYSNKTMFINVLV